MTERLFNITVIRTLVVLTCCVIIGQGLAQVSSYALPVALVMLAAAVTAFFLLPESALVPLYFCYLINEGALKILTNYNPIIHVASDLVLLGVFWRLFQRKRMDPTIGNHEESVKTDLRTAIVFFALYWVWVAIQFINPLNLGLLPSLAGLKLHLIPYLCFFIVCFYLKAEEVERIPLVLFGITLVEAIWSVIDWAMGVQFIGRLSYNYVETYVTFLQGYPYRPFGTTALPGQPSVWVANGVVALFLLQAQLKKTPSERMANSIWYRYRALIWLYVPVALLALVVCQVRTMLIRTLVTILVGVSVQGRRQFAAAVLFVVVAIGWNLMQPPPPMYQLPTRKVPSVSERLATAFLRFRSLQSTDTYKKARGGTWAFEELMRRGATNSVGFGLSRISASAAPWAHLARLDQYFPPEWGFADNLWLAVFTELGFFGLVAYVSLFASLIVILLRKNTPVARFVALSMALAFAGGYASEGLLYQPEASTIWTLAGIGMREVAG